MRISLAEFWSQLPAEDGDASRAHAASCDCSQAELDLAALADGNLRSQDMPRLAVHIAQCHACKMVLAVLISNEQPVTASGLLPVQRVAAAAARFVDGADAR